MMMKLAFRIACAVLAFLTTSASGVSGLRADADQNQTARLDVHLSIAKKTFSAGESIPLEITISNEGETPVVIGSYVDVNTMSPISHIEFEMKDSRGRVCPHSTIDEGLFPPYPTHRPAIAVLRSWMALQPGYSLSSTFTLEKDMFPSLETPGTYTLRATYSSPGLSYPPSYQEAGLTEKDLKELPYIYWSGRATANVVKFEIVAVPDASHPPAK
jgi:hypothetical protein